MYAKSAEEALGGKLDRYCRLPVNVPSLQTEIILGGKKAKKKRAFLLLKKARFLMLAVIGEWDYFSCKSVIRYAPSLMTSMKARFS